MVCKKMYMWLAVHVVAIGPGSPALAEAASPAVQWTQPGSAGAPSADLPFFFLDAHEEPNSPDTVYLFGKASACCLMCGMPASASPSGL